MPISHNPVDPEARGKLRRWRADIEKQWLGLNRVLDRDATITAATAMIRKGLKGRQRAFEKLARDFQRHGARLKGVRLCGPQPLAMWAVMSPIEKDAESPDPTDHQGSVFINAILAGRIDDQHAMGSSFWCFEAMDHALGRLLQRDRGADVTQIMLAAHDGLLRAPTCLPLGPERRFLLPAGNGAFACEFVFAGSATGGVKTLIIRARARTWLHRDQLSDEQEEMAAFAGEASPGSRLIDKYLIPTAIREIEDSDGHVVRATVPLPELRR